MNHDGTIGKHREKYLWKMLDKARGEVPMEFLPVVNYLRAQGENLGIDDQMHLQQWFGEGDVTASVAQFFSYLIGARRCSRVLNPAKNLGLLGAWIADRDPTLSVDVVSRYNAATDVIAPLDLKGLTLHVGSLNETQHQLSDSYDAVVASGPISLRRERRTYETATGNVELSDEPACLLIVDISERLSLDGFIAVVVSPRFSFESGRRSVRANLERFGLHLSALLSLRPGTFIGTSLGFNLAVIDHKPRKMLFVAEVPEDLEGQKALVERLRKRKQGPTASQGRLVDPANFYGLAALEARERYDKLAKNKGLEAVPFSSAVPEIRVPRRGPSDSEYCEEHPHAVYLPEMATTNATTRQDELPPKLKSYLQLLVDPVVVLPEYLAGWLNAPLGQALQQSAMIGSTIPRIRRSILEERKLYLPTIEDQRMVIQTIREIQRIGGELGELESRLWDKNREVTDVAEAVGKVNHEDRLSDWIETLPFPLASILRSYYALDCSPKEKYEQLLHFFEAFTEFCAAIHLSAFKASNSRWQQQRQQISKVLRDQHLSLAKASFGSWRVITELMASNLRKMLADEESKPEACALYATASASPLEMFVSAEVVGALQRVNKFRNRWTGHGGAVTESEAEDRHELLVNELARLRKILGLRFNQYQLIEARECEVLDGPVFRCRIRRVMGSNPQLEHDTVDLTTPAVTGRLYLHNPGHDKALELVPLVQVCDRPQPASYFYNRIEGSKPQLISYHFATPSEMSSDNRALLDFLEDFEMSDTADEVAET